MMLRFPANFLWGAATAAYQIEGAADEDGRGPSIWDAFARKPGAVTHGDSGAIACDHYHRWEADLDLMASLGLRSYRFSVAWPRVLPEGRGAVNQRGLDFYKRLIDGLHARGITPMATLYHWDLPQALEERGGWANRDTTDAFAEYAAVVYEALGDEVPFWITLNEPWCAAYLGYGNGKHAPGITDGATWLSAAHHLLLGHGKAVSALRAKGCRDGLGITLNLSAVHPASDDPRDVAAARRCDGHENRLFLDPLFRGSYPDDVVSRYAQVTDWSFVRDGDISTIAAPLDLLGVNYYLRHRVADDSLDSGHGWVLLPPTTPRTAVGIGTEPSGLTEVLVRLKNEYTTLPLYVTENGAAYHDYVDPEGGVDDVERVSFFDSHFRAAHAAIAQGVELRGYYVWSLLDNFEWADGYSRRYGIVFVDFGTQRRIPKQSAYWYQKVIQSNGLTS
jgi:beta-glucosidase